MKTFSATDVSRGDRIELPAYSLTQPTLVSAAVNVPIVAGATAWSVSTPTTSPVGGASALFINVAPGETTTPILGTALDAAGALAMYGETDAPIDPAGPSVTLVNPVAWRAVPVVAQHATAGHDPSIGGDVYRGDQDRPQRHASRPQRHAAAACPPVAARSRGDPRRAGTCPTGTGLGFIRRHGGTAPR